MSAEPPVFYPALFYADAATAIAWLERAFGFRKLSVYPAPDGSIVHAEMTFGAGVIMLGSTKPDKGYASPKDLPGVNQVIYSYCPDPDAHFARARAEGAEIMYEPRDTEYGSREYGAKDPEGHQWSFGTYHPAAEA